MKKIIFTLFCGWLCAATFTARAQGGSDGNISWSISGTTLTISGTGAGTMNNYSFTGSPSRTTAPWGSDYASITSVIIENSVTLLTD